VFRDVDEDEEDAQAVIGTERGEPRVDVVRVEFMVF